MTRDEAEAVAMDAAERIVHFLVRERTHEDCPPEIRFVSRLPEIPGEWPTREAATKAVVEWIMHHSQ